MSGNALLLLFLWNLLTIGVMCDNCGGNLKVSCDQNNDCMWNVTSCITSPCQVNMTAAECVKISNCVFESNRCVIAASLDCSAMSQNLCEVDVRCLWNVSSCVVNSSQSHCMSLLESNCVSDVHCKWNTTSCVEISKQEECIAHGGQWFPSNTSCSNHCSLLPTKSECVLDAHCNWNTSSSSCVELSEEKDCTAHGGHWVNSSCITQPHNDNCTELKTENECTTNSHCEWNTTSCVGISEEEKCIHHGGTWHSSNSSCTTTPHEESCSLIHSQSDCEKLSNCKWNPAGKHCATVSEPEDKCEQQLTNITCQAEKECFWVKSHQICVERPEEEEEGSAQDYFFITVIIVMAFSTVRIVQKLQVKALSESAGVIMCGAIIGGVMYLVEYLIDGDLDSHIQFDEEIFALFILPPIIFEAGFTLEHKGVMKNLGTILLYAVLGTLISACTIGFLVYGISSFTFSQLADHPGAPFISLAFGALLSAVDPVAVIAVLGQKFDLKKPPLLYNLVFGEAVLNDAVSIVLYNVMITFVDQELTASSLLLATVDFIKISVLSCLIGYLIGCLCSLFVKHVDFTHHPSIEIIIIGAFALGSYYLAEMLSLSGIMSLFICGRIEGHHAMYNLSQDARESAVFVFKTLAHLAETYVFVLLGQAFWSFSKHNWNFGFIGMVYLIMLLARGLNIFPLSAMANTNRKRGKVTGSMQFFMWFSGLRGAIAFGLSLIMLTRAQKDEKTSKNPNDYITVDIARVFVSTTLMMVVLTVVVMGAFTEYLLAKLQLTGGSDPLSDKESPLIENDQSPESPSESPDKSKALMSRLARLDEKYISPILRSEICHVSYIHPHEAGILNDAGDEKIVEMEDAVIAE